MDVSADEIKIRKMTEADLPRVREIDELLVGEGRVLSWPLEVETEWTMSVYRPLVSFVAQLGDKTVGFLLGDIRGAEYGTDTGGWIDMMGIAPALQHRGIGRKLVEAFCEECQRSGLKPNLIIREDDERLMRFWTSVGFRRGKLVSFER
jgi:ribosomal protein S18 acetylase RimI-like enzyme